ncbi:hypothetical protein EV195_1067 [Tenacibaculum skagerrakense]|uniref:Uncharacterized protein n=1 Tax=Tenacibaculum skagerrakense TaxID=186571 RepID=A0A4R2NQU6_9FLAO|nr:hypothetical protein [Tenacibaculum skagerrakense]TCP24210.1 hypothetical protein EV195_1067 [Tenacibaculum skagerrakense]
MKKLLIFGTFLTLFISCQDDVKTHEELINSNNDEILMNRTGFISVDEESNCEDYNSFKPSSDGITGSFTLKATLDIYEPNTEGCNYITFTGKYNKQTKELKEVKVIYDGTVKSFAEIQTKFVIHSYDVSWYNVTGNKFRLNFIMEKQYARSNEIGIETYHFPTTPPNPNITVVSDPFNSTPSDSSTTGDNFYVGNTKFSADFGVYSVQSEGKMIEFELE